MHAGKNFELVYEGFWIQIKFQQMNLKLTLSLFSYVIFLNIGSAQSDDDLYGTPKVGKYIPGVLVNQADTIECFILKKESYYSGG